MHRLSSSATVLAAPVSRLKPDELKPASFSRKQLLAPVPLAMIVSRKVKDEPDEVVPNMSTLEPCLEPLPDDVLLAIVDPLESAPSAGGPKSPARIPPPDALAVPSGFTALIVALAVFPLIVSPSRRKLKPVT